MAETNEIRLVAAAKELNVGTHTILEHLKEKGFEVENKPTFKLSAEMYSVLLNDFQEDRLFKKRADEISLGISQDDDDSTKPQDELTPRQKKEQEEILIKNLGTQEIVPTKEEKPAETREQQKAQKPKVVGKIDLDTKKIPAKDAEKASEKDERQIKNIEVEKLSGPKVVGKIDLPPPAEKKKLVASSSDDVPTQKKKRKRLIKVTGATHAPARGKPGGRRTEEVTEISEKEIQEKIKQTLSRLETKKGKGIKAKLKKQKRDASAEAEDEAAELEKNLLQLTEFVSASELAALMDVSVTDVIQTCMNLGVVVSINQRLDAEIIELVTNELGFEVKFINAEEQEELAEVDEVEEEDPKKLKPRAPIVTIMGHVDHGKTSLLDYIRESQVVAGEAGGITQHIAAYEVSLPDNKTITFLDTPGHEAFTAMRARGAKITDIAVIVIAADDDVMPQTKEAISHAQAAGVPMIFAINKIDKEGANPEKVKESLSQMNLLVEDWGGKYQSQDISAKNGDNVDQFLEKIILEADILELKANPDKLAIGSVIEASLDKGKGYVCTILVQEGTLRPGDSILAGPYAGKVKALFNERGMKVKEAGPSTPVIMLGLDGAPQAGEKVKVMKSESEARQLASKREKIQREQGFRSKKHITLDEIGRRLALGTFKELNILIKGDVDGSIEALSDSLEKLSTKEIQVNIVHRSVGQITESDILLASASDAIILGFQVRPSLTARQIAEKEDIEIRHYSIIYDAIEEIKSAMEGMLEPTVEEKIVCNLQVRDIFKITRIGTIAGCFVQDGKITRNTEVRLIRDGVVIYTGKLSSLKRFKDDVKEVTANMECGISIENFNDIKVDDVIEGFEQVEIKRKLS